VAIAASGPGGSGAEAVSDRFSLRSCMGNDTWPYGALPGRPMEVDAGWRDWTAARTDMIAIGIFLFSFHGGTRAIIER